jgi:hypothetical protein
VILVLCHCGHDVSTHFDGKHTCLGMLCDCTSFRNRDLPDPPKPKARVALPVDDGWSDPTPQTHPTGCTCIICVWIRP